MHTIASRLAGATLIAARHLGYAHPLAAAQMAGQSAGLGKTTLALVILIITILVVMKSAVRGLSGLLSLLSDLLRALAAMASILFISALAIAAQAKPAASELRPPTARRATNMGNVNSAAGSAAA